jgi:hypothetical protein
MLLRFIVSLLSHFETICASLLYFHLKKSIKTGIFKHFFDKKGCFLTFFYGKRGLKKQFSIPFGA